MDTINVITRTTVFTLLVLWWPQGAVVAFSTAQLTAVVVYASCYYLYFAQYLEERRSRPVTSTKTLQRPMSTEDDFPFTYMTELLPRQLENQVLLEICLKMKILNLLNFSQSSAWIQFKFHLLIYTINIISKNIININETFAFAKRTVSLILNLIARILISEIILQA